MHLQLDLQIQVPESNNTQKVSLAENLAWYIAEAVSNDRAFF